MRLYRMPSSSRAYPLALERKAEAYGQMLQAEGLWPDSAQQTSQTAE